MTPAHPDNSGPTDDPDRVTAAVTGWLERFVIAENLCPFAGSAYRGGEVRIGVEGGAARTVLERLAREIESLLDARASADATALLALTHADFAPFDAYLDLVALGDGLVDSLGRRGLVQLASFHPDYRFAGEPPDDVSHWTNRSPWPLLHLLREDALERALERHPDPGGIPTRNVERLRALGRDAVRRRARPDDEETR